MENEVEIPHRVRNVHDTFRRSHTHKYKCMYINMYVCMYVM